jgi:PAS domain S-box-containing protein
MGQDANRRAHTAPPEDLQGRVADLVRRTPYFLSISDANLRAIFLNEAGRRLVGLVGADISAITIADFVHPDDQAFIRDTALPTAIRDGFWEGECRFRHFGDSRIIPVEWRVFAQRDADGRLLGLATFTTDVTERKEADTRLRESEERFRTFAQHSMDVLWILDLETSRLTYLSPAFERLWGESPDTMMRDPDHWLDTIHPEDRASAAGALERVRYGEVATHEYRIVRADGSVRCIRDTFFPIRDEDGQVYRAGGIAQDVTKRGGSPVYVVDGDDVSREQLALVMKGAGYEVKAFASARAFLEVVPVLLSGCVLVDTRALEAGDLAIPQALKHRRFELPVIVAGISHGDVGRAVGAMKAGAIDFLDIPYDREMLLGAVASALADIRDAAEHDRAGELARTRIAGISAREREVLNGLLAGGTNKTIAKDLGISPRTVESHRAHVMERLGARTLPEAVLTAAAGGLWPFQPKA